MNDINRQLAEWSEKREHNRIATKLNDLQTESGIFAFSIIIYFVLLGIVAIWYVLHLFGVM
jgi:hypothetical protein